MIDYTLPLDQLPDPLPIEPLRKPFDVTITPPGSKSITCRAYVLAALAEGESKIIRPLRADDPDHLLKALCTLGAEARWEKSDTHDGEDVYIKGVGGRFPRGGNLYMGDGGAPTRFMIAAACLASEPVTIDASPRMRQRPIATLVRQMNELGANIDYVEEVGCLPVHIMPTQFLGGDTTLGPQPSSQVLSAMLLVAAFAKNGLLIHQLDTRTSDSYVSLTISLLRKWNVEVVTGRSRHVPNARAIQIKSQLVNGRALETPNDASSAGYFAVASAMYAGCQTNIQGLPSESDQPDALLFDAIEDLGMKVSGDINQWRVHGTGGYSSDEFERDTFDFSQMPDSALPFACCAAVQSYAIRLTGLRTLRVKETDRIAALANELRKVGCTVDTGEDWIEITPPSLSPPHGGGYVGDPIIIETYNDHRMAMSFAVLGLNPPNGQRLAIRNPKCVAKSYPTFWKDFAKLYAD